MMNKKSKKTEYIGTIIYLISDAGYVRSLWLVDPPEGKYFLEEQSEEVEDAVCIEAKEGRWHVCSNAPNKIIDESKVQVCDAVLTDQCKLYIRLKQDKCILYAERINSLSAVFHNYQIDDGCQISIGRLDKNDLVYSNQTVSGQHAIIERSGDHIVISDANSLNGVFVNGKKVEKQELCLGDTVFIMGLKLIAGIGFLSINDGNGRIKIQSPKIHPYSATGCITEEKETMARDSRLLFNRLPRRKRKNDIVPINISPPPFSMNSNQAPIMLRMGSSMVMGGSALMRGNYTSVLSMLLFPLMNHLYSDKDKKEYEKLRTEKYTEYLAEKKKEIENEKLKEEIILNENYPALNTVITYPIEKKRLWERGYRDEDFLRIRIGYGKLPLMAPINFPEKKFDLEEDPLEKQMYLLADNKVFLENVPVIIPLAENHICAVTGKKNVKADLLMRMIMQIAFLYSYDEVKIVLLLDQELVKKIPIIRVLPHVWNDERNFRFLATDLSSSYLVGEYLNKQLETELKKPRELKEILKDRPYYIVFAWNKQIFDSIEVLKNVAKEEKNVGVSVITFLKRYFRHRMRLYDFTQKRPIQLLI